MISTPYLLFLGDAPDQLSAKVAQGIKDWRPENAVGQFRLPGCGADLGLNDLTLQEAFDAGAKTLVIGVANRGGVISAAWKQVLIDALRMGFDLASGLHNLLRDEPDLVDEAVANGRKLHDVRVPSVEYPIANGKKRSGKRCLAVGTDCSVGKMYTAMAMDELMRTDTVLLPQSISDMAAIILARALALSEGATESSRSRLITSAALAAIFSKIAGLDPGPNNWQRFGRATGVG